MTINNATYGRACDEMKKKSKKQDRYITITLHLFHQATLDITYILKWNNRHVKVTYFLLFGFTLKENVSTEAKNNKTTM